MNTGLSRPLFLKPVSVEYSSGSGHHKLSTYIDYLRTTVPFVAAHLEIFHSTHHPVIPKSDLYFTFCSTLNALSKTTSK